MPLLVLISGPGLELRPPHVGPCNSAEPRTAWVTEAGALRTRVRKEGLRLGSEASCSGTGLPAVELPGLLGQILLPSVSPRVFVFVCFCSSDSGSAMRLAELSVRAFEVGAQGWGACCVQAWGLRLPPTLSGARPARVCAVGACRAAPASPQTLRSQMAGCCFPGRSSWGARWRRSGEFGRSLGTLHSGRADSRGWVPWAACLCTARSGGGGGGSVWDCYCVEFDFSRPARGKLASLGTAGIIYRELANQTQQSNLTFPSPRKFLQLGATAR